MSGQTEVATQWKLLQAPAPGCPHVLNGELVVYLEIISEMSHQHRCLALSPSWNVKVPEVGSVSCNATQRNSIDSLAVIATHQDNALVHECPKIFSLPTAEEQFEFTGCTSSSKNAGVFGLAPGPQACAVSGVHGLYGWSMKIAPKQSPLDVGDGKTKFEELPRGTFELMSWERSIEFGQRIADHYSLVDKTLTEHQATDHSHSHVLIVPLNSRLQLELPLRSLPALIDSEAGSVLSQVVGKELRALVDPNVEAIYIPGELQVGLLQKINPKKVHFGQFSIIVCETALRLEKWPNLEVAFASLNGYAVRIDAWRYAKKHPTMDDCLEVQIAKQPWREGNFSVILGRPFFEMGHVTLVKDGAESCHENGCLIIEANHHSQYQDVGPFWPPQASETFWLTITWRLIKACVLAGAFLVILCLKLHTGHMGVLRIGKLPAEIRRPLLTCNDSLSNAVMQTGTAACLLPQPGSSGPASFSSPSSVTFSIKYFDTGSSRWRSFSSDSQHTEKSSNSTPVPTGTSSPASPSPSIKTSNAECRATARGESG